jgi:hypothetical protein
MKPSVMVMWVAAAAVIVGVGYGVLCSFKYAHYPEYTEATCHAYDEKSWCLDHCACAYCDHKDGLTARSFKPYCMKTRYLDECEGQIRSYANSSDCMELRVFNEIEFPTIIVMSIGGFIVLLCAHAHYLHEQDLLRLQITAIAASGIEMNEKAQFV